MQLYQKPEPQEIRSWSLRGLSQCECIELIDLKRKEEQLSLFISLLRITLYF